MRSILAATLTNLQSLDPAQVVALFQFNTAGLRYTAWHKSLTWNSLSWTPQAIECDGLGESLEGEVPRVQMVVMDVAASLQALFQSDSWRDDTVTVRLILQSDIGSTTAAFWETTYAVELDAITQDQLALTLASKDAVRGLEVPRITTEEVGCQRVYQRGCCTYRGSRTSCDKGLFTPNGCLAHFPDLTDGSDVVPQPLPYLAFPGSIARFLSRSGG